MTGFRPPGSTLGRGLLRPAITPTSPFSMPKPSGMRRPSSTHQYASGVYVRQRQVTLDQGGERLSGGKRCIGLQWTAINTMPQETLEGRGIGG